MENLQPLKAALFAEQSKLKLCLVKQTTYSVISIFNRKLFIFQLRMGNQVVKIQNNNDETDAVIVNDSGD